MNRHLPLLLFVFAFGSLRTAMACQPVVLEQPTEISLCPTGNNFFFADFDDNSATFQWQQSTDDGATWTDMMDAYPFTGSGTEVLYLVVLTLHLMECCSDAWRQTAVALPFRMKFTCM